jgi:hypothetical protein
VFFWVEMPTILLHRYVDICECMYVYVWMYGCGSESNGVEFIEMEAMQGVGGIF